MFSFRTTPIEEQLDRGLLQGRVGCFCTQNCFDTATGRYLYDIFKQRGNLVKLFQPEGAELTPGTNHIEFSQEDLEGLDALVVEIQDVGSRYFNFTRDVMRLLSTRARMEEGPSIYIVDHFNPAGRSVEGTIPAIDADIWTPRVAHRHGLTLGELCSLYVDEIGAKFPLHVISAATNRSWSDIMPWTIAPSSDLPGLFSVYMYSGGGLWNNTTLTPAIGTARPYEYIGAPWLRPDSVAAPPCPEGVIMRPCSFTPSAGRYSGEKCLGYQIILKPEARYHSLLHTLELMRYFAEHYSQFEMLPQLHVKVADPVISEYLRGGITFDIVQEHVKAEEQKWIRKAKRYLLYDDPPIRIK
ncbi:MAG: DUF1343 domain-containing protein [Bacteroidales bacterium]|nr:DUF1343 domain-containing protein [Bacteroidales bacterium]